MPWVRFDDQFAIHRKVGALSDAAFRLHVEAICWCARNLTDGFVATSDLPQLSRLRRNEKYAAELVARNLWSETPDGWMIHDYLEYQPTRSKVLEIREKRKAAGQAGGLASGQSRRGAKPAGKQGSKPKPKQVGTSPLEHPDPPSSSKKGSGRGPAPPGPAAPELIAARRAAHGSRCPYPTSDPTTCSVCISEAIGAA